MKKHILTLIGIAIFCNSYSQINPIREQYFHSTSKSEPELKSIIKIVPTIIKESEWSSSLMNWLGETQEEYFYENNLVKSVTTFNYNRTDTLSRKTLTYNTDNYLTLYLDETYVGNGVFEPKERIYYIYENNYNKMTSTEESYSKFSNIWYPETIEIEEKLNNGETIRFTQYIYILNEKKPNIGKSTTIKKLNNNTSKITEIIDSLLNFNTGEYVLLKKVSKIYDVNENAISIVHSGYNNGTTIIEQIDSINYINNIPYETITYKFYDGIPYKAYKRTNMVWKDYNTSKDFNENQLTDYTRYIFSQNSWNFYEKISTAFTDTNGSNIYLIERYISNSWVPLFRSKLQNNKYAHVTLHCREEYDQVNSKWDTTYGYGNYFQYNVNENMIEQRQFFYYTSTLEWQNTYKWEYFDFITISTGIASNKNTLETTLYPNPSADGKVLVNVKMEAASVLSIKITDLKGSIVYTDKKQLGKGLNTVELSGLQQGMYFIVLSSEYGVSRSKLVVN